MKFKDIDQLKKFIIDEELDLSKYNIRFIKESDDNDKEEDTAPINESTISDKIFTTIVTFSDKPVMETAIGDENILYVDSYESMPNVCGTGKIQFLNKTLLTNICEMDGSAHITLPVDIAGKGIYNVTFKLKELSEKSDNSPSLILEEALLDGKIKA